MSEATLSTLNILSLVFVLIVAALLLLSFSKEFDGRAEKALRLFFTFAVVAVNMPRAATGDTLSIVLVVIWTISIVINLMVLAKD